MSKGKSFMTVVAIDFGTSNTVVSILDPQNQQPKTISFPDISQSHQKIPLIPSLVYVQDNHTYLFGEQVKNSRVGLAHPERLFKNFKRYLTFEKEYEIRKLDEQEYTPKLVTTVFFKEILSRLKTINIEPSELILTVPVGAFEKYSDWLRSLAQQLNIAEVKLIDESTAAAIGYGINNPNSLVLVVDFGGGTLDLSLIRTADINQEAEVIAKSDGEIGGEDINEWIVEDLFLPQIGKSSLKVIERLQLLEKAEKIKIELSTKTEAKDSFFDEEKITAYSLSLKRKTLEQLLEDKFFLERLNIALDEIIDIARVKGIREEGIQEVLLVGGTCLIPAVQELIKARFQPYQVKVNKPFEAVSHGALMATRIAKINDYLRHSYTIRTCANRETNQAEYRAIFAKESRYPQENNQIPPLQVKYTGQDAIELNIFEIAEKWDSEVIYDSDGRISGRKCQKTEVSKFLGKCLIPLNPLGEVGVDRILVKFAVSIERVLEVTAIDLLTNKMLLERKIVAELD